jgi:hypothetical protein
MDQIRGANPFPDELSAPPIQSVLRRLEGVPAAVPATRRRGRLPSVGAVMVAVSSVTAVAIAVLAIVVLGHRTRDAHVSLLAHPATQDAGRTVLAGGCGVTTLYRGSPPPWTAPAFSDSSPGPPPWPFALSARGTVVAVVFGYPLRAGAPTNPSNKVLWIMRLPRDGSPLKISARPLHATAPVIRSTWSADSSPGEIYPSGVNVPRPGCWRLTLDWAGHTDWIDLRYSR